MQSNKHSSSPSDKAKRLTFAWNRVSDKLAESPIKVRYRDYLEL